MGKLHDQMREDLLLKAYSPNTMRSYLRCARHFAKHYMRSPEEMGAQEVRDFLLQLIRDVLVAETRACAGLHRHLGDS